MAEGRSRKLGYLTLAPGIGPLQIVMLVLTGIICTFVTLVIPTMQPYVLEHQLHLDPSSFGQTAGMLALVQNVAMLTTVTAFGAMHDRTGPRTLIMASMLMMGLGCFSYPFVTSLPLAIAANAMVGLGMSAFYAGFGPCVYSYPDNVSRGKLTMTLTVTQMIASSLMIGLVGANLPKWLGSAGLSPFVASGAVFWAQGLICLLGVFLARRGFAAFPASGSKAPLRPIAAARIFVSMLGEVLSHARAKPKFGMLLLLSCAFRADLVVVITFMSLWVVRGASQMGVDSGQALQTVGALLVVLKAADITGVVLYGFLADRLDRGRLLLSSLMIASVAFASPLFVSNVLSWQIYLVVILLGFSEGVAAIATQTMLGQETPAHLRGSVVGAFTVVGMLASVAVNAVGGRLFDTVSFTAPFVMVAAINATCLLLCLLPGPQSFLRSALKAA